YLDALSTYNTAAMKNVSGMTLSIMEYGLPGLAENSKKILYLAASGVGSGALCVFVLVLLFLTDRRITHRVQLQHVTKGTVLGELNAVRYKGLDIGDLWKNEEERADFSVFKNHLRALRFELGQQLGAKGKKVLLVTSLKSGAGKTFLSSGLAYAFAMTGKKVLMIGNTESIVLPSELRKKKELPMNFDAFLKNQEIE